MCALRFFARAAGKRCTVCPRSLLIICLTLTAYVLPCECAPRIPWISGGTGSSNPASSSGESANFRPRVSRRQSTEALAPEYRSLLFYLR